MIFIFFISFNFDILFWLNFWVIFDFLGPWQAIFGVKGAISSTYKWIREWSEKLVFWRLFCRQAKKPRARAPVFYVLWMKLSYKRSHSYKYLILLGIITCSDTCYFHWICLSNLIVLLVIFWVSFIELMIKKNWALMWAKLSKAGAWGQGLVIMGCHWSGDQPKSV